ncbi:MAG TPA: hypothetical protein VFW11_04735 [Cyclobacteriaceae bacterium]|nr:hypothetical protein [Cyclobacteriaceae bacterium]
MKPVPICLAFLILIVSRNFVFAQGCSDAGFCTMGAMKPDQPYNKKIEFKLRTMEISFYRGTTTLTPIIYSATADFNFSINNKTSFQVKVPYQAVTGRLADTKGLGDISLCLTRTVFSSERFDINFSVGTKLPTNQSDKDVNGLPLPMYYQTSLGSYDFIAGLSLISPKWLFATGVQHAFNENGNQFLWTAWINGPEDIAYVQKYANAKELKRGTDIMMRVERNFRFSRLNFTIGLLPIYRITKDEITDGTGNRVKPAGTTGMALSAIVTTGYNFNVQSGIKLLIGHKITQRDENPDGLTRELVITLGYYYRF